jgi:uncharacterized protein (DUF302 family)
VRLVLCVLPFVALLALVTRSESAQAAPASRVGLGIVRVPSAYGFEETVTRLKTDIERKGLTIFATVDQTALAAAGNVTLPPSTLIIFGSPSLGAPFIAAHPNAGLDWPDRILVTQDPKGKVWALHTDVAWVARRHGIKGHMAQFDMVASVIASITTSVRP